MSERDTRYPRDTQMRARKQGEFPMRLMVFTRRFFSLIVLTAVLHPRVASAANSVVVESRRVVRGATGVTIPVRLTNDVPLRGLVVPLVLREASAGAFITSLQLSFADRLASPAVLDLMVRNHLANEDGDCKNGLPGGFKTITFSDGASHPVAASPVGVMFVRYRLSTGPYLSAGYDVAGSLVMTVNISGTPGEFEIDTTCQDPANHLVFVDSATSSSFTPSFTKGTIVIGHPVVGNLNDSGPGSFRAAIDLANWSGVRDSITFAVAGTIHLLTPLPPLLKADTISGTMIFGFTAPGASYPATPTVIVDGSLATPGAGLLVPSALNLIEGLTFRNFNGAGVALTGALSAFNTITACRFYANTGPGIDLGNDGITLNDPGDLDNGPNALLNYPVFESVSETGPGIFALAGTAPPYSRVELYVAAQAGNLAFQPESTSHGPAYLFLNSVTASPGGSFAFPSITLPEWSVVTATATDSMGSTSELALNRILTPDPLKFTAYSEPVPPVPGVPSMPLISPAIQVIVFSPLNSLGKIDSIGPSFNTFGAGATYDSLTDYNAGGTVDVRVAIFEPDTGVYRIEYLLVGDPGNYVAGIGIDGHADLHQAVSFVSPGQIVSATFDLAPPQRGELNGDGKNDVQDVIAAIGIVFSNKPLPNPPELIDVNCDAVVDVADVLYLIRYTFSNGPAPCQ